MGRISNPQYIATRGRILLGDGPFTPEGLEIVYIDAGLNPVENISANLTSVINLTSEVLSEISLSSAICEQLDIESEITPVKEFTSALYTSRHH